MGKHGKNALIACALLALAGSAGGVVQPAHQVAPTMLTDDGYKRTRSTPERPRNREERRGDAHAARVRRKQERKSNGGKAARRLRGRA